jgi:hypothetical protein
VVAKSCYKGTQSTETVSRCDRALHRRSKQVVRNQLLRVLRVVTCFNIFIAAFDVSVDDVTGAAGGACRNGTGF